MNKIKLTEEDREYLRRLLIRKFLMLLGRGRDFTSISEATLHRHEVLISAFQGYIENYDKRTFMKQVDVLSAYGVDNFKLVSLMKELDQLRERKIKTGKLSK